MLVLYFFCKGCYSHAVNDRKGKESQRSNQGCKETTCRKLRHPCLFSFCVRQRKIVTKGPSAAHSILCC